MDAESTARTRRVKDKVAAQHSVSYAGPEPSFFIRHFYDLQGFTRQEHIAFLGRLRDYDEIWFKRRAWNDPEQARALISARQPSTRPSAVHRERDVERRGVGGLRMPDVARMASSCRPVHACGMVPDDRDAVGKKITACAYGADGPLHTRDVPVQRASRAQKS